jgi:isoleucyl-tRNA synthetase
MKSLFWSVCLSVLCASALQAQNCHNFPCVIAKVKKLMTLSQRNYQYILDNLDSAEGFLALRTATDDEREQVKQLRKQVFQLIENERVAAQTARKEAEKQTKIAVAAEDKAKKAQAQTELALKQVEIEKQVAIAEKNKAQAAENKTKQVLDKIYFYDGKFGLAYDKSTEKYGFIDPNLNTKIKFEY